MKIIVRTKRITRSLAEQLTKKLIEHKLTQIELIRKNIVKRLEKIEFENLDSGLMGAFLEYREYFKDTTYRLANYSNPSSLTKMTMRLDIPKKAQDHGCVDVDKIGDKKLDRMCLKLVLEVDKYFENKRKISSTIYAMKTLAKLNKDFPEAGDLVEYKTRPNLPAPPLENIRSYISN